jgi:hypothetical protein
VAFAPTASCFATAVGTMYWGSTFPENPIFVYPVPLSMTTDGISDDMASNKEAQLWAAGRRIFCCGAMILF